MTIVTSSKWLAGLVRQSFLQAYPLTVINFGIDLTHFAPTTSDFRRRYKLEDHFILLGVAFGWDERKGFSHFMALAKQLRSDEKIVMVGVSEQQIRQLPPGVVGIPRTDSLRELAEIYSAADLFLNPTMDDNFPTTNLEALACGTPVVTFKTGGSPECLDDECGLVVERGDLPGLVAAIQSMRRIGKGTVEGKCRKRAQVRFDKDAQLAEYLKLYKNHLK